MASPVAVSVASPPLLLVEFERLKLAHMKMDEKIKPFVDRIGSHVAVPTSVITHIINMIKTKAYLNFNSIDAVIGGAPKGSMLETAIRVQTLYQVANTMKNMAEHAIGLGYVNSAIAIMEFIPKGLLMVALEQAINKQDDEGLSPIFLAAINTRIETVESLLELYADVRLKNDEGEEPLHYAVCGEEPGKVKEIVRKLLIAGASPNAKNHRGETPMHYLIEEASPEIILPLLKDMVAAGGELEVKAEDGKNLIDTLLKRKDIDMAQAEEIARFILDENKKRTKNEKRE